MKESSSGVQPIIGGTYHVYEKEVVWLSLQNPCIGNLNISKSTTESVNDLIAELRSNGQKCEERGAVPTSRCQGVSNWNLLNAYIVHINISIYTIYGVHL